MMPSCGPDSVMMWSAGIDHCTVAGENFPCLQLPTDEYL